MVRCHSARLCLQYQIASIALTSFHPGETSTLGAAKEIAIGEERESRTRHRDDRRNATGFCTFLGGPSSGRKAGCLVAAIVAGLFTAQT